MISKLLSFFYTNAKYSTFLVRLKYCASKDAACASLHPEIRILMCWSLTLLFPVNCTFTGEGSLRSTGVDVGIPDDRRMDVFKPIKKEEDPIARDELLDQFQLPLRSFNVNEASSSETNYTDVDATHKYLRIVSTRKSMRGTGRKGETVHPQKKPQVADDDSAKSKFHELKKSTGSPAQRSRCVSCFNRNILESERMPKPKTKWVTTFCGDCPGKPFLCILCFSRIHCNNRIGIREEL